MTRSTPISWWLLQFQRMTCSGLTQSEKHQKRPAYLHCVCGFPLCTYVVCQGLSTAGPPIPRHEWIQICACNPISLCPSPSGLLARAAILHYALILDGTFPILAGYLRTSHQPLGQLHQSPNYTPSLDAAPVIHLKPQRPRGPAANLPVNKVSRPEVLTSKPSN